jgi:hypothetical protein
MIIKKKLKCKNKKIKIFKNNLKNSSFSKIQNKILKMQNIHILKLQVVLNKIKQIFEIRLIKNWLNLKSFWYQKDEKILCDYRIKLW